METVTSTNSLISKDQLLHKQDENGDTIRDWMTNRNMILLNLQQECEGKCTWQRGEQKSVIDVVIVNRRGYMLCKQMHVDEDREIMDISDHNMITVTLSME